MYMTQKMKPKIEDERYQEMEKMMWWMTQLLKVWLRC